MDEPRVPPTIPETIRAALSELEHLATEARARAEYDRAEQLQRIAARYRAELKRRTIDEANGRRGHPPAQVQRGPG